NAGSRGGRLRRAGLRRAGAASRLSCRGFHGQGRGSTAKSGEERDGGIGRETVGPRRQPRAIAKKARVAGSRASIIDAAGRAPHLLSCAKLRRERRWAMRIPWAVLAATAWCG